MYRIWFQFKRRIAWEKSHELKKNQAKLLFSRGNIVKEKDIQDIPMEKIFKKRITWGKSHEKKNQARLSFVEEQPYYTELWQKER